MEIRVLRYFLEVARQGNMTKAATRLHVTQPTLSKQIKDLEEELGKKLFVRGSSPLTLTEEGMILRKRAEDLLAIANKIEDEFRTMDDITAGTVSIGCAESKLIRYLAKAAKNIYTNYPNIQYTLISGDTSQVTEKLENGVLDLAFIVESPDLSKYNYIEVPDVDIWGVYMPKDHPLSMKDSITVDDLLSYPLLSSAQSLLADFPRWCGEKSEQLPIIGQFNLLNNALIFTKEEVALTLGFQDVVEMNAYNSLTFRPLKPQLTSKMYCIWKKHQVFTPAASLLLQQVQTLLENEK